MLEVVVPFGIFVIVFIGSFFKIFGCPIHICILGLHKLKHVNDVPHKETKLIDSVYQCSKCSKVRIQTFNLWGKVIKTQWKNNELKLWE